MSTYVEATRDQKEGFGVHKQAVSSMIRRSELSRTVSGPADLVTVPQIKMSMSSGGSTKGGRSMQVFAEGPTMPSFGHKGKSASRHFDALSMRATRIDKRRAAPAGMLPSGAKCGLLSVHELAGVLRDGVAKMAVVAGENTFSHAYTEVETPGHTIAKMKQDKWGDRRTHSKKVTYRGPVKAPKWMGEALERTHYADAMHGASHTFTATLDTFAASHELPPKFLVRKATKQREKVAAQMRSEAPPEGAPRWAGVAGRTSWPVRVV